MVDELDLGVEVDGGVQQLVESPGKVVEAVSHLKVPGRKNPIGTFVAEKDEKAIAEVDLM